MSPPGIKLFLTGDPGCGKTTLVRRVIDRLSPSVTMRGFVTEELREQGKRTGFRGRTLDGQTFVLAHVDSSSPTRVGAYGVEREGLESIGVPSLRPQPGTQLVILDEIGKMESFSQAFREAVRELLDSPVPVLGTVAAHGVGFVKRTREDPRLTLVRVGRGSRDALVDEVVRLLRRGGVSGDDTPPGERRLRHDVNNLLMGLMGHVELLRDTEGLPDGVRRRVDAIADLVEQLRERVRAPAQDSRDRVNT